MDQFFSKKQASNKIIFKILGSGCCVPSLNRSAPSNLIKFNNKSFLIDMGPGTLKQLLKAKEDYKNIDGIILSHRHPDHCADLIPYIQALCHTPEYTREKNLIIIGSEGTENFINSLLELYGFNVNTFKLVFKEPSKILIIDKKTKLHILKGNHTKDSIIKFEFNINDKTKTIVYTGDTAPDQNISEFAQNCNLLITECSFPFSSKGHLSPEEAAAIAQNANAERLLLTHFYPPCDNYELQLKDRIKEHFLNKILIAQDFMEIII